MARAATDPPVGPSSACFTTSARTSSTASRLTRPKIVTVSVDEQSDCSGLMTEGRVTDLCPFALLHSLLSPHYSVLFLPKRPIAQFQERSEPFFHQHAHE